MNCLSTALASLKCSLCLATQRKCVSFIIIVVVTVGSDKKKIVRKWKRNRLQLSWINTFARFSFHDNFFRLLFLWHLSFSRMKTSNKIPKKKIYDEEKALTINCQNVCFITSERNLEIPPKKMGSNCGKEVKTENHIFTRKLEKFSTSSLKEENDQRQFKMRFTTKMFKLNFDKIVFRRFFFWEIESRFQNAVDISQMNPMFRW